MLTGCLILYVMLGSMWVYRYGWRAGLKMLLSFTIVGGLFIVGMSFAY